MRDTKPQLRTSKASKQLKKTTVQEDSGPTDMTTSVFNGSLQDEILAEADMAQGEDNDTAAAEEGSRAEGSSEEGDKTAKTSLSGTTDQQDPLQNDTLNSAQILKNNNNFKGKRAVVKRKKKAPLATHNNIDDDDLVKRLNESNNHPTLETQPENKEDSEDPGRVPPFAVFFLDR